MEIVMDYTKQAIEFMKKLIAYHSAEGEPAEGAPFGQGVRDCLDYALRVLQEKGFRTKNGAGYYGYGEIGEGDLFGVLCHLDVVPEGEGWNYDPYGAEEHDGRVYGRGALDDKGPFAACFFAAVRLLAEGYTPTKRLRFILGCDEESGWKCMDSYCLNEEMPKVGFSPDGDFPVINCEKGIVYHTIKLPLPADIVDFCGGERANMVPGNAEVKLVANDRTRAILCKNGVDFVETEGVITVKADGKAAHGSHPEAGDNAIIKLLFNIKGIDAGLDLLGQKFDKYDGSHAGIAFCDKESGGLTLNLGCARTENGVIIFELDIRHPITYRKDDITAILKEELSGLELEQGFFHLPLFVDRHNELVEGLLSAYNETTGQNAEPVSIGGGTYARVLPLGVAFGPCFPGGNSGMHCADEYMELSDFEKMSEIYYRALKRLCFTK